jgi:hypothetical protein
MDTYIALFLSSAVSSASAWISTSIKQRRTQTTNLTPVSHIKRDAITVAEQVDQVMSAPIELACHLSIQWCRLRRNDSYYGSSRRPSFYCFCCWNSFSPFIRHHCKTKSWLLLPSFPIQCPSVIALIRSDTLRAIKLAG